MILVLHDAGHGYTLDETRLGPHERKALSEAGYSLFKAHGDQYSVGEIRVREAPPAGSSFGETGVDQVEGKTYELYWAELPLFDWEKTDADLTADPQANRKIKVMDEERVQTLESATEKENRETRGKEAERATQAQQRSANVKPRT